jgi:hypothetical protein
VTFEYIASVLTLLGLMIELTGVVLTAYEYMRIPKWQLAKSLVYALWRDKRGTDILLTSKDLGGPRPEHFVQGISLICLGIFLHICGGLVEFGGRLTPAGPSAQLERRADPANGEPNGQNQLEPVGAVGNGGVKK